MLSASILAVIFNIYTLSLQVVQHEFALSRKQSRAQRTAAAARAEEELLQVIQNYLGTPAANTHRNIYYPATYSLGHSDRHEVLLRGGHATRAFLTTRMAGRYGL